MRKCDLPFAYDFDWNETVCLRFAIKNRLKLAIKLVREIRNYAAIKSS